MNQRQAPSLAQVFYQRKMAALLLLGFSSGLPAYLTSRTLQAWMTVEGVDLGTVGKASLLGLPLSLKFLWAPFMDRYVPPFLGRRRGWLIVTQVLLGLAIAAMSLHDPKQALTLLFANAVIIAFLSASQDIAFDAYRIDALDDRELGTGAALGVLGYRAAMIFVGGVAFMLADHMPWNGVYLMMAATIVIGFAGTFLAPEPVLRDGPPATLATAVVQPFLEFLRRSGLALGVVLLLFVLLFSFADRLVQNMAVPFLLKQGYTQTEIGAIQNALGLAATMVGVVIGGVMIARLGINRSIWIVSFLQIGSNLAYYFLSIRPKDTILLTAAITVENLCGGLVTAAFVSYMMSLCSRQYAATQYALLSSMMAVSRDVMVAPAGSIAERTGFPTFFLLTIAAGIPALLLLPVVAPLTRDTPRGAAEHTGEVALAPDDPLADPNAPAPRTAPRE
ncbi:MAG TPA: AmpG family muropeptide MFS transporter [Longimicrobium sp.]|nr:AmpG family muropeptide MFS transporter [Longimicrobium sp.]